MKRWDPRRRKPGPVWALLLLALLLPGSVCAAGEDCYPACPASEVSLVDALKAAGADASFSARGRLAAENGIEGYRGTAEENLRLLTLMKRGELRKPAGGPLAENTEKIRYIRQENKTCKASAVAMALNLLLGSDRYTTRSMGGANCESIQGLELTGSDGRRYTGVYKTDRYVGSLGELTGAVDAALEAGLPAAAAVHSTLPGRTKHHWVLILGRQGEDYLMADPAWGTEGSIGDNAVPLSSRSYAFGLTDCGTPHYGYVTFTAP